MTCFDYTLGNICGHAMNQCTFGSGKVEHENPRCYVVFAQGMQIPNYPGDDVRTQFLNSYLDPNFHSRVHCIIVLGSGRSMKGGTVGRGDCLWQMCSECHILVFPQQ